MDNKNYQLRLFPITILLLFLTVIGLRLDNFANDPGLGWHIKTGEYILQNLKLPVEDPFSFTNFSGKWLIDQWLADILISSIFSALGWPFLYVLLVIIFVYTYGVKQYSKLTKIYGNYLLAALVVMYSFYFAQVHFICRPVLFSFFFFLLLFYQLYSFSKLATAPKSLYLKIFITIAFWANMHPSFVIAWGLFAVALIASFLAKDACKKYLRLSLVMLLATLLNPYGFELYYTVLSLSVSQIVDPSYSEWESVSFSLLHDGFFALPSILLLIIICIQSKFIQKYAYFILSFLLFSLLANKAVRFLPYFGITSAPILMLTVPILFQRLSDSRSKVMEVLGIAWKRLEYKESLSRLGVPIFVLCSVGLLISALFLQKIPLYNGEYGPTTTRYSKKSLDYLLSQNRSVRVINDSNLGGYLIGWGKGRVKGLLDDRTTMHGTDVYAYYNRQLRSENIFNLAKILDADYLLLSNGKRYKELVLSLIHI